ncbi:MAG: hypothetical protein JRF55_11890 [Deltaproteobacteria bacterium]|nr:hypothetical protein [Deltaproteobacteria bacterium]
MGVSLAVAIASARTASPLLERTHDIAWLVVALLMLDLVLPRETTPPIRSSALGGLALAALMGAVLKQEGLVPVATFGVVVVGGVLVTAALHQIVLVGRGHVVEGALSGIALVTLAVGLAYSWFGPFGGTLATTVEFAVASLLWLGHLAWLDPQWRSLRRVGVPAVAACALCFLVTFAFVPDAPLQRWQLGMLALSAATLAAWHARTRVGSPMVGDVLVRATALQPRNLEHGRPTRGWRRSCAAQFGRRRHPRGPRVGGSRPVERGARRRPRLA